MGRGWRVASCWELGPFWGPSRRDYVLFLSSFTASHLAKLPCPTKGHTCHHSDKTWTSYRHRGGLYTAEKMGRSPFLVTVTSGDEADHWTGGVKGPASSVACFVPRYRGSLQKGSWCVTVHVGDDRRVREVKRRIEIKLFKVQVDTSVEQL